VASKRGGLLLLLQLPPPPPPPPLLLQPTDRTHDAFIHSFIHSASPKQQQQAKHKT
jgi:hypothetical protein